MNERGVLGHFAEADLLFSLYKEKTHVHKDLTNISSMVSLEGGIRHVHQIKYAFARTRAGSLASSTYKKE